MYSKKQKGGVIFCLTLNYVKRKMKGMSCMNKTCGSCGTSRSTNQFYKLPNGEYSHICKVCVNKQVKEYYEQLDSYSAALWLVLAELNVPFFQEQWKDVELMIVASGSNRKPDLVLNYLRSLAESGKVVRGFWESDTMLDQIIDTVVDRDKKVEEELDLVEQQRIWGRFEVDDYEFLNLTFNEYTQELLEMDANLIRRYRDLAKAELRKRKADESGDIGEITKAQDSLNKQLALLKLNNFKDNKQSDTEKFIERMAWNIENTKPAECEDTEKYRDFSNFGIKWEDIMRTVKNLVAGSREYPDIPRDEL